MSKPTVYLDHAATTPLRLEAAAAMLPWLTERFGNPSGSHAVSRSARQAVDEAREVVAAALGADPSDVVFTGGGTEAVQAFPWLDVAALAEAADLVAISGHKFGGPQGVGALVVRHGAAVDPIVHGGGQERDRRSGTHNVAGIVGLAAAVQATVATRAATVERGGQPRDRLADGLRS